MRADELRQKIADKLPKLRSTRLREIWRHTSKHLPKEEKTPPAQETTEDSAWARRPRNSKQTCVDFIKQHFGTTNDDGIWDSQGLSMSDLKQADKPLWETYRKYIKRNPDHDLGLRGNSAEEIYGSYEAYLEHLRTTEREKTSPDYLRENITNNLSELSAITLQEIWELATQSENNQPSKTKDSAWTRRPKGSKQTCLDFIKEHYGAINDDGTWDPKGFTMSDLRQADEPLWEAYRKHIKRNPEQDLGLRGNSAEEKYGSAENYIKHRRARAKAYYERTKKSAKDLPTQPVPTPDDSEPTQP